MATITFTATRADGTEVSRTSGTMAYTHTVDGITWHKSYAGAVKSANYSWSSASMIVEVFATKVNGKVDAETRQFYVDAETDWTPAQRQAILDLIDAKMARTTPTDAKREAALAEAGFPVKETPAQARARQRAAKKERDAKAAAWEAEMAAEAAARATEEFIEGVPSLPVIENHDGFKTEADLAVVDAANMVLVKVDGKPQARLDTATNTLVWRNSAKGRAARAAGLWA